MREKALAQAKELDEEQAAGNFRSPLHGIPIGIKDSIDTAGVRTTAASAVYEYRFPTEDAEVVRRLKAAGRDPHRQVQHARVRRRRYVRRQLLGTRAQSLESGARRRRLVRRIGRRRRHEQLLRRARHGCGRRHPHPRGLLRRGRLQADLWRVSLRGIIPFSWSLDHCGPIARTVEDAAMVLQQIAGYDHLDIDSVDKPVPDYSAGDRRAGRAVPHRHPACSFSIIWMTKWPRRRRCARRAEQADQGFARSQPALAAARRRARRNRRVSRESARRERRRL